MNYSLHTVGNSFLKTVQTMIQKTLILMTGLLIGSISGQALAQDSWVDLAVHNIGEPINTMWAEGELSFAADGTMVFCSAREDMAVAPGDPKDLYIATF
ncbi:MAG: hypothetical protein HOG51_14435, partial [Gammaproteobacteria bacterium]|nr:hypothetical protein [Gammaproteobacteria bacterium]